jgi:hypothetical protein
MPREPLAAGHGTRARRTLPATQTALLALITDPVRHPFTPAASTLVVSDGRASADERVQVYAYMYRARITEALQSQFPRLARLLGGEAFAELAFAYVTEHPSRIPRCDSWGRRCPSGWTVRDGPRCPTWPGSSGRAPTCSTPRMSRC